MNNIKMNILLILMGCVFGFVGCLFDEEYGGKLVVELEHKVDEQELVFDSLMYVNSFGSRYKVTKLVYYLSNFTLYKIDGSVYKLSNVFYFDGEDVSTHVHEVLGLRPGDYSRISFTFGLIPELNRERALSNTNINNSMVWPFGGGYHFMKLEGFYLEDDGTESSILTHIGKGPGGQENHFNVFKDIDISIEDESEIKIPIRMNVNAWYNNPNNYDFRNYTGIMQDSSAQAFLRENGAADVFTMGTPEVRNADLSL